MSPSDPYVRRWATEEVRDAARRRRYAQTQYVQAVAEASRLGLTQAEIGAAAGVSQAEISRMLKAHPR
jgi:hypothetical protein